MFISAHHPAGRYQPHPFVLTGHAFRKMSRTRSPRPGIPRRSVTRAFIKSGQFDLDAIAAEHCAEFSKSVVGWGDPTREAVTRMVAGTHWSQAAQTDKPRRGTGKGVAMKVAPVGLYMALTNQTCAHPQWQQDIDKLAKLATMTHATSMAVTSGLAQAFAVLTCFRSEPETFNVNGFVRATT
jgi:ADP-ribosylglycohydrolase